MYDGATMHVATLHDASLPSRAGGRAIAIIVPYGNDEGSFFSESIQSRMCEEARALGHAAHLVRVYYDGNEAHDDEIRSRLVAWLDDRHIDLIVTERLFDSAPIHAYRERTPGCRVLLLAQGEVPHSLAGIDFVLGDQHGRSTLERSERAPADQWLDSWLGLLEGLGSFGSFGSLERDERAIDVAGVSSVVDGVIRHGRPMQRASTRRPFRATVDSEVIATHPPPKIRRKTLHGTFGCPYSGDPLATPHHAKLALPVDRPIARLGCAFCPMGGDYIAGTDASIVRDLIEQAAFWLTHDVDIDELVLADQHPIRYLAPLMREAREAGLRSTRWLFAARADAFVREADALESAIVEAERGGYYLEVYLTGFESFSDDELLRYNKGVTVDDELLAVARMRELHERHPETFEYARSRGHSLILWNPWTAPSDLEATVVTIRTHGLRDIFHDLGRNRLRLYPNLPIFYAARRDGALDESWDEAGEGTARTHGYGAEHPWTFLDPRTRLAYALSHALREYLGAETELAQLAAVTSYVQASEVLAGSLDATVSRIVAGVTTLDTALRELRSERSPTDARRPSSCRAAVVAFSGACNNGCRSCSNADRWVADTHEALVTRVDRARTLAAAAGEVRAISFAGREPTLHPSFGSLVARARGTDGRHVGVVTNGRRFAYPRFTLASRAAGLAAASVKLFGAGDASADAYTRVPGAHAQALAGIAELRRARVLTEVRIPLHAGVLHEAERLVELAASLGVSQIVIDTSLDAVSLARVDDATAAIRAMDRASARAGMLLRMNPLSHPAHDTLPVS